MATYLERYDAFVFDLDGTLADTRADLAASVNHALGTLGLTPLGLEEVTLLVGDGARKLLERAVGPGAPPGVVEEALRVFLEHYDQQCTRTTRLYPGVVAALEGLRSRNCAVLTNKPLFHSRRILSTLGIDGLLSLVVGGDSFPLKKPDPEGLRSILRAFSTSPGQALVVGDSGVDVRTARAGGAASALVTYGFRPDAAREDPPDHILHGLVELLGEIRS